MHVNRRLQHFATATSVIMFIVLVMGALVTSSGSADGCGDTWPLCHGRWVPEFVIESLIEYSHRIVSAIAGLMVIVLAVGSMRALAHRPETKTLAYGGIFFVVFQGLLGAMAVMWGQSSMVLALHFGFSLISFAAVLLLNILIIQERRHLQGNQVRHRERPVSARLRFLSWFAIVYTYIVVYSGAYVRHTNANLACTDWPLCNGQLWPGFAGPVGIQFAHRLGAALLVVVLALLYAWAHAERKQRPDLAAGASISFILVLLQVVGGGYVVLSTLSLASTLLHGAIVSALFGSLSYLCLQVLPEPKLVQKHDRLFTEGMRQADSG